VALRFRYRSIERPEPLGPKTLPVIPITYLGTGGESFESAPILDSGADFSVIFKEHAEILGVDLGKCEETECQGIGGKVKAWKTKIPIRLKGKGEHRAFNLEIPTMILERQAVNHTLLIGRAGFFEHFEICFNEKERTITLKPIQ